MNASTRTGSRQSAAESGGTSKSADAVATCDAIGTGRAKSAAIEDHRCPMRLSECRAAA